MLKSIALKNFQCHGDKSFDLHPGVNVFCGKSGQGKSAGAIRPIKWVVFNRPSGEAFRKWGTKETEVTLVVDTQGGNAPDVTVSRLKSDKDNLYKVGDKELRAFGQKVPEEVSALLNMGDLNFAFQHDPLFLLASSPTEVARILNELAGLDQIDEVYGRMGKLLHADRQEVARWKGLKSTHQQALAEYEKLDELEGSVVALTELQNSLNTTESQAYRLEALVAESTQIKAQLIPAELIKDLADRVLRAESARKIVEDKEQQIASLGSLAAEFADLQTHLVPEAELNQLATQVDGAIAKYQSYQAVKADLTRLEEAASYFASLSSKYKETQPLLIALQNRTQLIGDLGTRADSLTKDSSALDSLYKRWAIVNSKLEQVETKLGKLHQSWDEVKGEFCPLCGKEW